MKLKKMVSYFFEREIKQELINDPSLLGKNKRCLYHCIR